MCCSPGHDKAIGVCGANLDSQGVIVLASSGRGLLLLLLLLHGSLDLHDL